jgi:glycosyltransferase involved in cell wall biosynthesis
MPSSVRTCSQWLRSDSGRLPLAKTVKILLVGNYAPDQQYSMLGFCSMMELELRKAGHSVRVVRPEVRLGRLRARPSELGKWLGYIDKFILFPAHLRTASKAADVVHICDHSYSLYTRHCGSTACVVTCHDLIAVRAARGDFPEVRTRWSGRKFQRMVIDGLNRARHVTCDSEATRSDVLQLCSVPDSRTSVGHICLNFAYRPASKAEKAARLGSLGIDRGERFILHVGSPAWYKNQPGMIRIFKELAATPQGNNFALVMVSKSVTPSLMKLITECGLQRKVRILSHVQPEDLRAVYSAATALVFPSLREGFGWPILEAQACGCPVFTSNRAPMTEVGGDGAIYIDPEEAKATAATIVEHLPNAGLMREAGFANVRKFSAEEMISGYIDAYDKARKSAPYDPSAASNRSLDAKNGKPSCSEARSLPSGND